MGELRWAATILAMGLCVLAGAIWMGSVTRACANNPYLSVCGPLVQGVPR
jgi:hypothetical protein